MAKAVLHFRTDVHGFEFVNRFNFDATERSVLSGIGASVAAALAGLLPPLPGVHIAVPIAAGAYLNLGPLPAYGLCGGMAYAAADYWRARAPFPRGNGSEPQRTGPGAAVRAMLWNQLLQSLTVGGVLMRTLHWMMLLNIVPEFASGGALNLRNLSTDEYRSLKSRIDLGSPVPIGLVGTTLGAWDQHQVLVYGYEDVGSSGARLYLYDPNSPRGYGNVVPNIAEIDFSGHDLSFTWPSMNPVIGTVKGFFCSNYGFTAPDPGLARSFGLFQRPVSGALSGGVFMIADGAKFPLAGGIGELSAFGANAFDVMAAGTPLDQMAFTTMRVPVSAADPTGPQVDVPSFTSPADDVRLLMDGTLLRERTSRTIFLSAGGAMFSANAAAITFFGGPGAVRSVPAGSLAGFPVGPQHGQLLRELSSATIWLIESGTKREMTPYADFGAHGGRDAIKLAPDGALLSLPVGPRLPQPAPGECQRLKTQEAALVRDLARADEVVGNATTQRAVAAARAARLRVQQALAEVRGRRQVLGCP